MQQENLQRREASDRFEIGDARRFLRILINRPRMSLIDGATSARLWIAAIEQRSGKCVLFGD
ncbi:MAG TPA: hypothetical protein VGO01_05615 [Bradyrhizobium sp.]|nr:hypothetical protein [Bradyrhizobium sp.]